MPRRLGRFGRFGFLVFLARSLRTVVRRRRSLVRRTRRTGTGRPMYGAGSVLFVPHSAAGVFAVRAASSGEPLSVDFISDDRKR